MKRIRTKHGFFFNKFRQLVALFKQKPRIYNLNQETDFEKGIFISNHSAASGPMTLSLFFPSFFIPWGAHEMTLPYTQRWKYLYYIFYQRKLKYKKEVSFVLATLFAMISKMLYNGMQLIPTYTDYRYKGTVQMTLNHLDAGNPVLIFPEDSNTGYHEILQKYHKGFVYISELYFKKHQQDLPVYPVYYHKDLRAIIIGKKQYIQDLIKKGLNRSEIAEHFKNTTNELANQLFQLEKR